MDPIDFPKMSSVCSDVRTVFRVSQERKEGFLNTHTKQD